MVKKGKKEWENNQISTLTKTIETIVKTASKCTESQRPRRMAMARRCFEMNVSRHQPYPPAVLCIHASQLPGPLHSTPLGQHWYISMHQFPSPHWYSLLLTCIPVESPPVVSLQFSRSTQSKRQPRALPCPTLRHGKLASSVRGCNANQSVTAYHSCSAAGVLVRHRGWLPLPAPTSYTQGTHRHQLSVLQFSLCFLSSSWCGGLL